MSGVAAFSGETTVGHTLLLWTASLLAQTGAGQIAFDNQANDRRACGCQAAPAAAPSSGGLFGFGFFDRFRPSENADEGSPRMGRFQPVDDNTAPSESRPGLFSRLTSRIGNLFGRSSYDQNGQAELGLAPVEPGSAIAVSPTKAPITTTLSEPPLGNVPADNKVVQAGFAPSPAPAAVGQGPTSLGGILPKNINRIGHEEDYSWVTGQVGQVNGQWVIHYATPETADKFGGKLVLAGVQDMSNFHVGDLISVQGGLMAQNGRVIGAFQVQNISLIERK
jgi:hypothetical protein